MPDAAACISSRIAKSSSTRPDPTLACTSDAVMPDGVGLSMFRCFFPWSGSLDGIEISYFDSIGAEWNVAAPEPNGIPERHAEDAGRLVVDGA